MSAKYRYCLVKIEEVGQSYYYIADSEEFEDVEILPGDNVVVPFGADDQVIFGKVTGVGFFNEEEAPYPPEMTKRIIDVVEFIDDEDEEDDEIYEEFFDLLQDDIGQYEEYINCGDFEGLLDWCNGHMNLLDMEEILTRVMEGYEICLHNEYMLDIAATNLGTIYYDGVYVPRDFYKAAELYEIGAEAGSIRAICNLGYCFYYGRHTEVDYAKAYEYFNMGALMDDSNCLYKIGDMYMYGLHVAKNEEMAFAIYAKAFHHAEEEDGTIPDINFRLGKCSLHGLGIEPDIDFAMSALCSAYAGFYTRRGTDPFVINRITECRSLIEECEEIMEYDFL